MTTLHNAVFKGAVRHAWFADKMAQPSANQVWWGAPIESLVMCRHLYSHFLIDNNCSLKLSLNSTKSDSSIIP